MAKYFSLWTQVFFPINLENAFLSLLEDKQNIKFGGV